MEDFGQFRRHHRAKSKPFLSLILTIAGICVLMIIVWQFVKGSLTFLEEPKAVTKIEHPLPAQGEVYVKSSFALSYVEAHELPEWVAYTLTIEMLNAPKLERDHDFEPDPAIKTRSAHWRDYKDSGYRRGHLVPAGDMSWNDEAMAATFLMSNITPMRQEFNDGIWLDLEHRVRDWARHHQSIDVVTGPVLGEVIEQIGENEVSVPRYYYKAIFTDDRKEPRVIGFLFDQTEENFGPLSDYIVTIDSLEKVIGFDLFENRYGNWDTEIELEQTALVRPVDWPWRGR